MCAFIFHIVAQIVETKFIVGRVGDVAVISRTAFMLGNVRNNHTRGQPKKTVNLAHPFGVTARKIVVHGDNMHALAFDRVQIARQSLGQCFAFTGAHFGNFATMEHDTADHLHIEMAHTHHALRRLTHRRKCLRQNIIKRFAGSQAVTENLGLPLQPFVIHDRNLVFERVDLVDDLHDRFDVTVVGRTENGFGNSAEHN